MVRRVSLPSNFNYPLSSHWQRCTEAMRSLQSFSRSAMTSQRRQRPSRMVEKIATLWIVARIAWEITIQRKQERTSNKSGKHYIKSNFFWLLKWLMYFVTWLILFFISLMFFLSLACSQYTAIHYSKMFYFNFNIVHYVETSNVYKAAASSKHPVN